MLITKESTPSYVLREAGGKGLNLYRLAREGFPVPAWVVLGASFFRKFVAEHSLSARIDPVLGEGFDPKVASEKIRALILDCRFSPEMEAEFQSAYSTFRGRSIAVRSSALDEDSAGHSFA